MARQNPFEALLDAGKVRLASNIEGRQEFVSTGSLLLDHYMAGGFFRGQSIELYGPKTSGKSLICNMAIAAATNAGYYAAYYDGEKNHQNQDANVWRERFGMDMDKVYQIEPGTAEQVIDTAEVLRESLGEKLAILVIDSVGALISEKALKKNTGEAIVADRAKLLWEWMRKLMATNRHTAVVFINQEVPKIGSYMGGLTTPGGEAPKYFCHQRVRVRGTELVDSAKPAAGAYGMNMKIEVKKLKGNAPKLVPFETYYDYGKMSFDVPEEVLSVAEAKGIVEGKPPFYRVEFQGEEIKKRGRENFKQYLQEENTELYDYLKRAITE